MPRWRAPACHRRRSSCRRARYRIVYSLPGQASRMTSVKVPAAGSALFQQEFPHGVVESALPTRGARK